MKNLAYYFVIFMILLFATECAKWIIENPLKATRLNYYIVVIMYVSCIVAIIKDHTTKGE